MKGSPILATALACLIMLVMYVGMRVTFSSENPPSSLPTTKPTTVVSDPATSKKVSAYVEIYFSAPPKSISISQPATGNELINLPDPSSSEWNGNIALPIENLELEIQCKVEWKSPTSDYHFMQVTISPDEQDPQTRTLRATGDILDIMHFQWKEGE